MVITLQYPHFSAAKLKEHAALAWCCAGHAMTGSNEFFFTVPEGSDKGTVFRCISTWCLKTVYNCRE
jgi:hypothetical protein